MDVAERYERLEPTLVDAFHLPLMTRIAVGGHWERATEEQRERLVAAFQRMSTSTVATLFSGYNGERFEAIGTQPGSQGTTLVQTHLVKADGSPVEMTYVAKQFGDRWWLIDVVVDGGISELNVRQSEYHAILRDRGVEGLIDTLNGKADSLVLAGDTTN